MRARRSSRFCGETFLPPEVMIRSFLRSVMKRSPPSMRPTSPVWNQPSGSIASRVAGPSLR
jgi:hypothetical protein